MPSEPQPLVVLDTSVLISGVLSGRGSPSEVLRMVGSARCRALVSHPLLTEYREVLARPFAANRLAALGVEPPEFIDELFRNALRLPHLVESNVKVRDPKDQIVLETALTGAANFLVTVDKDFEPLVSHPDIGMLEIVSPAGFVARLDAT
ncbi:MAG: putative toxin-antitoxin system toxin component, PIN family [Thermomicrobiales bacterium]|nr:putative toxin-antitoxin system toxin component, PIN family [Thermomicrobiales bacterium]